MLPLLSFLVYKLVLLFPLIVPLVISRKLGLLIRTRGGMLLLLWETSGGVVYGRAYLVDDILSLPSPVLESERLIIV